MTFRRAALTAFAVLAVAGCGPTTQAAPPQPAFNDMDVMFAQMSIAHAEQSEPVLQVLHDRAESEELRTVADTLRKELAEQTGTMTAWLQQWGRPKQAPADAGLHAGHGELHTIRSSDVDELRKADDVDRVGATLLLGHLHNTVELARAETAGGKHAEARKAAEDMTVTRMVKVQTLLRTSAG